MGNALRRYLQRFRGPLTVAWILALVTLLGLWQIERQQQPDATAVVARGRPLAEATLRQRAEARLPAFSGSVRTVVVQVPFLLGAGWLVVHRGTLVAKQEFQVGPRGDTVAALDEAQVSFQDHRVEGRPGVIGGLGAGWLAWLVVLVAAWRRRDDDAFASYNRKDSAQLHALIDALRARGSRVWVDRDGVQGGDEWRRKIWLRMGASRVVLVFVGRDYPGPTQADEVEAALVLEQGGCCGVVPVVLPGGAPPPALAEHAWVDLRGQPVAEQTRLLLRALDSFRARVA